MHAPTTIVFLIKFHKRYFIHELGSFILCVNGSILHFEYGSLYTYVSLTMTYLGRSTAHSTNIRSKVSPWPHRIFEKGSAFRSMDHFSPMIIVPIFDLTWRLNRSQHNILLLCERIGCTIEN